MNEDTPKPPTAPGAGAGDAAQTQEIPHIPKPAKKAATKAASPAKKAASKAVQSAPETDKGRTREVPAAEPLADETPDGTAAPAKQRRIEPIGSGKPLTAADYARTTKPSPSTTAVIPAVKDEPAPQVAAAPADASGRRASLRLMYVDPWSVTRLAFAISVAMMIVGVVAMSIFWVVLDFTGVWGQVNDSITTVLSDDSSSFDITDYLGFWRLIGLTLVLSAINVILMTALATIGAHLYNLATQLLGGVEVTFVEDN